MSGIKKRIIAGLICAAMAFCSCSSSSSLSEKKESSSGGEQVSTLSSSEETTSTSTETVSTPAETTSESGTASQAQTEPSQTQTQQSQVTTKAADPAASAGIAMWECTDKNGNKITMIGSMHAAKSDILPLADRITKPFNEAQALVIECDAATVDPQMQALMTSEMTYSDGTLLKDKLSPDAYNIFLEKAAAFGMTEMYFKNYKPWAAHEVIESLWLMASGFSANYGLDNTLINQAKSAGKEIIELESVQEQLELYFKSPDLVFQAQIKALKDETAQTYTQEMEKLYTAWKSGDIDAIANMEASSEDISDAGLTDEEVKALTDFNKKLVGDRNVKMAAKLQQIMASGKKAFVVVGAAHYIGEGGIVDLLQKAGCTVKRR